MGKFRGVLDVESSQGRKSDVHLFTKWGNSDCFGFELIWLVDFESFNSVKLKRSNPCRIDKSRRSETPKHLKTENIGLHF